MRNVVATVQALITRLEHFFMGDAEGVLSPLTKVHNKLRSLEQSATSAADRASVTAAAMRVKAIEAARAAENIGKMLAR